VHRLISLAGKLERLDGAAHAHVLRLGRLKDSSKASGTSARDRELCTSCAASCRRYSLAASSLKKSECRLRRDLQAECAIG
jgi:hypothetical protein